MLSLYISTLIILKSYSFIIKRQKYYEKNENIQIKHEK